MADDCKLKSVVVFTCKTLPNGNFLRVIVHCHPQEWMEVEHELDQ